MPVFFQSRAGRQCLLVMALGVTLWLVGAILELDNWLVAFVGAYENYGADKLVLALGIGGAMSFVYSILRIVDLRKEMELRASAQPRPTGRQPTITSPSFPIAMPSSVKSFREGRRPMSRATNGSRMLQSSPSTLMASRRSMTLSATMAAMRC